LFCDSIKTNGFESKWKHYHEWKWIKWQWNYYEEDVERSKENASFQKEINKLEENEKIMQTIFENFPITS